jgi:hypothetical protein
MFLIPYFFIGFMLIFGAGGALIGHLEFDNASTGFWIGTVVGFFARLKAL